MHSGDISSTSSARLGSSNIWSDNGREVFSVSFREEDDEEALKWAAIEKLPSYLRIARGILTEEEGPPRELEIKSLGFLEKRKLLERLLKVAEEDNEKFWIKLKEQIDRPLKKHGVTDREICMISNIPPESADEVFVLAPSLKGKKNSQPEVPTAEPELVEVLLKLEAPAVDVNYGPVF